jgi:hypothetical protein
MSVAKNGKEEAERGIGTQRKEQKAYEEKWWTEGRLEKKEGWEKKKW